MFAMSLEDQDLGDPGTDHGEVFTRRWVVDLILDLVGYTTDRDLGAQTLIEPSCGTGSFLVPIVERLVTSAKAHDRPLTSLTGAIRAFDLLDANAERARKAVAEAMVAAGTSAKGAEALARAWIHTGDFLLTEHAAGSADYVVGNPPYIRLERIEPGRRAAYRAACPTMRGRADIYIGFIERGLSLLRKGGALSFICADRWMRNQYGADLRALVTEGYSVDAIISMHDSDAFEHDVAAYPAIVVLRNRPQGRAAIVTTNDRFGDDHVGALTAWVLRGRRPALRTTAYTASRADRWFTGSDLWPDASPEQLALIADIESRHPPLEDSVTGTRVGIGVATGCDDVFITSDPQLVESDRMVPLLRSADTRTGTVSWSGRYLVNPWNGRGLVDLDRYPRLAAYLNHNSARLRARHIARLRPATWYRTIDRVHQDLIGRGKLVIPDMKASAHPVLDEAGYYPDHNLYYVVSTGWDLEVLGGLLLSDIANLFVGAYCVRMRGGTYRFQAQYLRRIRVPERTSIRKTDARDLAGAFRSRDREKASAIAARLYGVDLLSLRTEGQTHDG